MPEDKSSQAEAEQQPKPTARRQISPMLIVALVTVIGVALFVFFLLRGGKGLEAHTGKTQAQRGNPELLDIPPMEVADIQVSVAVESTAIQRRSLAVGVVIYFAPAEGQRIEVKELLKEFSPKANNLKAKFGSIVIKELNAKDYSNLIKSDVQDSLLSGFKAKFNEELSSYGLNKMAKVDQVVWKEFNWGN